MGRLPAATGLHRQILVIAVLFITQTGCQRAPAETTFGVEDTKFHCVGNECDISFFVNNQMPHSVDIRYKAVLSDAQKRSIIEISKRRELPALEKTRISETVTVPGQPARLRVTVTTLQGR